MATNIATHILAIPFPIQGHINPMIQLCNRLVTKGIRVTLVTTVSVSSNLQRHTGSNPMNIETVPDSRVDEVENLNVHEIFTRSFRAAITNGLSDIIVKHRPLTAILYDSVNPWILDIAHEQGLKGAVLFTQPCSVCSVFYHVHKGTLQIPPDDDASEVSLPGMPVMGVKDLPSLVYDVGSYPFLLRILIEQFSTFDKADWRLFNTFAKLEDELLKWMGKNNPILSIGPTVPSMYTDKRLQGNHDYGFSLFKPKTESWMAWLDSKQDHSVIYAAFGSLAELSQKQMEEIAWGLIDSKFNFLLVVRDTEQIKLFQDLTSENKGLIVNWCTQLEVLSHRAVGCFLTHCGWNSTLEALCLGVPMVAMPQWSDQPTNAKMIVDVWQTGKRVKTNGSGIVTREEIAARVGEVLQGDGGDEIRRNALKWKGLAIEAVSEGGSSDKNITEFATELMSI